jgi:nitrogen regulatory protein P-II 1
MKKIEAIIKPFKLEAVRDILADIGINGITISEVEDCGRRNGFSEFDPGGRGAPDFRPKIKLEIVVSDSLAGPVSLAIAKAARTGSVSDGSVLIFQVEEAIRIRTRETDELAVC